MKEHTKELRLKRMLEKKSVKEINNIGKRLAWCRIKLGLSKKDVALGTSIPESSYHGREEGLRTDYTEEYLVLAAFFNELWQKKYKTAFPMYEGREVYQITPMWIQYGSDDALENAHQIISDLKRQNQELELRQIQQEMEHKRQLDMFRSLDDQLDEIEKLEEKIKEKESGF